MLVINSKYIPLLDAMHIRVFHFYNFVQCQLALMFPGFISVSANMELLVIDTKSWAEIQVECIKINQKLIKVTKKRYRWEN